MIHPTSAQHIWHEDGTVSVVYSNGTAETYDSPREASIEATLQLFPGTSREWLESMHRG